jgi:hypothetical protein
MKLREKTMKLSDKTLNILKNFKDINQSILFKAGNKLRTISVMKNILAEAIIDEELPKDFGIYDLSQFITGLELHKPSVPELNFTADNYVVIKEGRMKTKYVFADPHVIITPPDKPITLPSEDVSFELEYNQLVTLLRAASIYQLPDLSLVGEDGVVKILVRDKKNDTSNNFSIAVGDTESSFCFNFKVENIKILPGTYDVVVSKKLLSRFTSKNYNLTYYIALEPDSTFE